MVNGTDDSQLYENLGKMKRGDLAWDGRLVATRGVTLVSSREETQRPLKRVDERHISAYELPKDVHLPYTVVASDKAGAHYTIKVSRIVSDGVEVYYRALAPEEVSAYVPVKTEK
jgi:hypothetical protein